MARTPDTRRGEAFRRWLHGLPRTTRRLVVAVFVVGFLAVWYGALLAADRAIGDGDVHWADPLSSMIGPLVGVGLAFWLRRRALGSTAHAWDFDRAVRRRRLPHDADPAVWGPLLDKGERFQRGARRSALGLAVFAVVLVVVAFAWAGSGWLAVGVAAMVGVVGIALLEAVSRRQTARIDDLREQLRDLADR